MNRDRDQRPENAGGDTAPEQERLVTPQEEADQDIAQLEDPPQAEGDRASSDEKK